MELLLIINSCRLASAESITVITPYFPYSKGDQSDYFGGNSMFGGFKMPTPRYQSRRSSYRY